jgi:hypothetical protein
VSLSVHMKPGQMKRPWPTSGFRATTVIIKKSFVDAVRSRNLILFDEKIQCFGKVAYYYSNLIFAIRIRSERRLKCCTFQFKTNLT